MGEDYEVSLEPPDCSRERSKPAVAAALIRFVETGLPKVVIVRQAHEAEGDPLDEEAGLRPNGAILDGACLRSLAQEVRRMFSASDD